MENLIDKSGLGKISESHDRIPKFKIEAMPKVKLDINKFNNINHYTKTASVSSAISSSSINVEPLTSYFEKNKPVINETLSNSLGIFGNIL